jgi:hypothetical protein
MEAARHTDELPLDNNPPTLAPATSPRSEISFRLARDKIVALQEWSIFVRV